MPNDNFGGFVHTALVFRAWDGDVGHNGAIADVSAPSNRHAFSLQVENAGVFLAPALPTQLEVKVSVQDGRLLIEGSDQADVITVRGVGTGTGQYVIATTKVSKLFTGVVGDIIVDLRGGDDSLMLDNVYVNGAIDIQTADGSDVVTLGNQETVSSKADLRIDLGGGNDRLDGKRLYIGANQIVHAGDGDDLLLFNGFAAPQFTLGTSAAGDVSWFAGPGDDTISVTYGFIAGRCTVDLNSGHDTLTVFGSALSGQVQLLGGPGSDRLSMDANFCVADLLMAGGTDDDVLLLSNGLGSGAVQITGEGGADSVTVRNQQTRSLRIESGPGNDTVGVHGSALESFFALLGDDDSATIHGNLSRLTAEIDGGLGNSDRLLDLGNSFFGYRKRRFEMFA